MPEPIEFRIVESRQAALQAISVGGGYFYDVRGTGVKLNPDYDVEPLVAADAPRPWITLETIPETWQYQPSSVVKLLMPLRVHWFGELDQADDAEALRMCYRAYSDIEKAIVSDLNCGGLAVDSRIVGRSGAIQGSKVWVGVDLEIEIYRRYGEASA